MVPELLELGLFARETVVDVPVVALDVLDRPCRSVVCVIVADDLSHLVLDLFRVVLVFLHRVCDGDAWEVRVLDGASLPYWVSRELVRHPVRVLLHRLDGLIIAFRHRDRARRQDGRLLWATVLEVELRVGIVRAEHLMDDLLDMLVTLVQVVRDMLLLLHRVHLVDELVQLVVGKVGMPLVLT